MRAVRPHPVEVTRERDVPVFSLSTVTLMSSGRANAGTRFSPEAVAGRTAKPSLSLTQEELGMHRRHENRSSSRSRSRPRTEIGVPCGDRLRSYTPSKRVTGSKGSTCRMWLDPSLRLVLSDYPKRPPMVFPRLFAPSASFPAPSPIFSPAQAPASATLPGNFFTVSQLSTMVATP